MEVKNVKLNSRKQHNYVLEASFGNTILIITRLIMLQMLSYWLHTAFHTQELLQVTYVYSG